MSNPSSREELKLYCLRRLGFPVIQLNLDDDQIEDRIDEALHVFQEFHFDGTREILLKHEVTAQDQINGYIDLANTTPDIIGVTKLYPVPAQATSTSASFNMFDITYQIRLNELYDFTSADYVYFVLAQQHLRTLEMLFIGEQPIRFNRYHKRIYVDINWAKKVTVGNYMLVHCRQVLEDSDEFWGDVWLKKYTTCLIKEQWGANLSKFAGVQLPGGITLDGRYILESAVAEKEKLEQELRDVYEEPCQFIVG
jgi:hypothetical protein